MPIKHSVFIDFQREALVVAFNKEKALISRGLLHDCETSNFAKVRFQLYLTTLLSVLSVPRSQLGSN